MKNPFSRAARTPTSWVTSAAIHALVVLGLFLSPVVVQAEDAARSDWYVVPQIGGWTLTPDTMTLIVADTTRGELLYIDLTGDQGMRRIEVEFKPTALAVQGNKLFAATEGSGIIHVLDIATGKEQKELKVQGGALQRLACHPEKGMLYAALSDDKIVSIDTANSTVLVTGAKGQNIVVDPTDAKNVYVGINFSSKEVVELTRAPGDRIQAQLLRVAPTAKIMKYQADGKALKLVRTITNASIGAKGNLAISPDGKMITLVSQAGFWDLEKNRRLYDIALFQTNDMKTMTGGLAVGGPRGVAFHPVLDLLAGQGDDRNPVHLFKKKSLVEREKLLLPNFSPKGYNFHGQIKSMEGICFAGKGTRLVAISGNSIHIVELELSDEDRTALEAKYKTLPPSRKKVAAAGPAIDKPTDLLGLVDTRRDAIWGDWSKSEGKLKGPAEGRLHIRGPVLPEEYSFTLVAERLESDGGLMLSLPVGEGRMLVGADLGYREGDGGLGFLAQTKSPREQLSFPWKQKIFPTVGKPATLTCTVRKTGVALTADGKKVLDWKGDPSQFRPASGPNMQDYHNMRERWYFPDRPGMFLYFTGGFRIHKLDVAPLGEAVAFKGVTPAEIEEKPFDLLASAQPDSHSVSGLWSKDQGRLIGNASDRRKDAFLQVPQPLPAEYALTVSVQRKEGRNGVLIGLPMSNGQLAFVSFGGRGNAGIPAVPPNRKGVAQADFKEGKPTEIVCIVHSNQIQIMVDRELVQTVTKFNDKMYAPADWNLPDAKYPFIGSQPGAMEILTWTVGPFRAEAPPEAAIKGGDGAWKHLAGKNVKVKDGYLTNAVHNDLPLPTDGISTVEQYKGPLQIKAVVRLDQQKPGDVRLFCMNTALLLIMPHNPGGHGIHIRRPGSPTQYTGTVIDPGSVSVSFKDWTTVVWRLTEKGMACYIDDKLTFWERRAIPLTARSPVSLCCLKGTVELKSLEVTRLKPEDDLLLPAQGQPGPWDHLNPMHYQVVGDHLQNQATGAIPNPFEAISTRESFAGPIEITAVIHTVPEKGKGDLRLLAFRSGTLIFNPYMPPGQAGFLVIKPDGGNAYQGTIVRVGPCPAEFKEWTKVTWRISADTMTVLVDDKEVYQEKHAFDLSIGGPVRVCGFQAPIAVKSLEVKPLK